MSLCSQERSPRFARVCAPRVLVSPVLNAPKDDANALVGGTPDDPTNRATKRAEQNSSRYYEHHWENCGLGRDPRWRVWRATLLAALTSTACTLSRWNSLASFITRALCHSVQAHGIKSEDDSHPTRSALPRALTGRMSTGPQLDAGGLWLGRCGVR